MTNHDHLNAVYSAIETTMPHEALREIAPGELERVARAAIEAACVSTNWKADWERIAFNLCAEFGSEFVADKQTFAKAVVREYLRSLRPTHLRTVSAQKRPIATETNVNEQRTEGDSGTNKLG